jgi:hypothetical protein
VWEESHERKPILHLGRVIVDGYILWRELLLETPEKQIAGCKGDTPPGTG